MILDVMMPHLDGFSVYKMAREMSNMSIIMLTAKSAEDQMKSVLKDKFCLMTFLLPIVATVALNFMGSIDLSILGEYHFGVLENDLPPLTVMWLE